MLNASIPNACDQKWNGMTPVAGGAFCSVCQTKVIDLSLASPEEIIRQFKEATCKKTCVKVFQVDLDQANTLSWYNAISLKSKMKFLFMLALVFCFSSNASAAGEAPKEDPIIGGMLVPMSDSAGYYPTSVHFNLSKDTSDTQFDLILKEDRIEISYHSSGEKQVQYKAITVAYDTVDYHRIETVLDKGTVSIHRGQKSFFFPLSKPITVPVEIEIEINGVKRYAILYPKNYYSGSLGF